MTEPIGVVDLVQKIVGLFDSASFDTTYKLATIEALIRIVCDDVGPSGGIRDSISAREISDRVLESYWDQTADFGFDDDRCVFLRQRSGGRKGDLIEKIAEVRRQLAMTTRSDSLVRARSSEPTIIAQLEDLAWKRIVDMPIPRLQRFGNGGSAVEERFLYDYEWATEGPKKHVKLARLNDTLVLKPGVGSGLLALHPLLLRHIEMIWIRLVAQWNPNLTDAGRLSEALFGGARQANALLAPPLAEMQNGHCFYCAEQLTKTREVDHFLPWSVTHNDNVENLVVACRSCNSQKSASYPALSHLANWCDRISAKSKLFSDYATIAQQYSRTHKPRQSIGQARSLYMYTGSGRALWVHSSHFVELDKFELMQILGD